MSNRMKETDMAREIKQAIERASDTILQDALGCAALVVLLVAGLYLPTLF